MANRAPAEAAAAPAEARAAPTPSRHRESPRVRTALKVSSPSDPAEREAEATAKRVMRMPAPARLGPIVARAPLQPARAPAIPVPRPQAPPGAAGPPAKARPPEETSPELEAAIKKEKGGGRPLPADVAAFMGPRFKADFSGVRIHTGARAENLTSRLGARAFAFGRDIFFNAGQFKPATPEGMELIAHELTHTIQQREVVQREVAEAAPVEVRESSEPQVQRGVVGEALDWIADKANYIPGFRLFTIVIGLNPVNMSQVDRSGANILRALIEFIPGGGLIVEALENHGVFQKGGKFIEDQFRSLGMVGGMFRDALMEFVDSLGVRDIFRLGSVWERGKRIFTEPVKKLIEFGKGLVSGIADIVKAAILKPLGRFAASVVPKWDLLVGVFGKNPISEEGTSPAAGIIGSFMELIGQGEIWKNIQQGNAVGQAWSWFKGAIAGALALVTSIPGRVMAVIRSLTIFDIVTVAGAFRKVLGAFGSFVGDFIRWAGGTVLKLLEIILNVVAPTMVPYLKKAGSAFGTIIKAPGTFIGTLVRAGKLGFGQFKKNILKHLTAGLLNWLLGSLASLNLYLPKSFELKEILKFGLSVVGLTWANVRSKLVAATNETLVASLEAGFSLVTTMVREGPAAAWEQLVQSLSNLKSMVTDAIISYVRQKVIESAIEKLVSMLTPAGAFIQAILAIYRTITFVVTKLSEIGRLVAAFIDSMSALAGGVVASAANRIESVLATGLSLAISFLANFAGLGNVSKKVIEIVNKIRQPVDKALDKLVKWIVDKVKKLGNMAAKGVKSLLQWWKVKAGFKAASGIQHTLSFSGQGRGAKLMMASTPRSFEDVLKDPKLTIENVGSLRSDLAAINKKIADNADVDTRTEPEQKKFQGEVEALVKALAAKLAVQLKHEGDLPASVVTFGGGGGRATYARAEPLTKNPGNTTGSSAKGRLGGPADELVTKFVPKGAEHERRDKSGAKIKVTILLLDQVHLLHSALHGPFTQQNIALGDKSLNGQMRSAETGAQAAFVREKVSYVTNVTYFSNTPPVVVDPIPDPIVPTVQGWVGYYVAKSMTVVSKQWDGSAYGKALPGASASGTLPGVKSQVIESAETSAMKILRASVTASQPERKFGSVDYVPTSHNRESLRLAMALNKNQMIELAATLVGKGVQIGYGRPAVIWIKK
jgi:hypothetical protein